MLATGQPGRVVASRGLLPECDVWWAVVGVTSPCSALVSSVRGRAMTAPVPSRVAHPGLDTRPRIVQSFRVNINNRQIRTHRVINTAFLLNTIYMVG